MPIKRSRTAESFRSADQTRHRRRHSWLWFRPGGYGRSPVA